MKGRVKPCEEGWKTRDHSGSAIPVPVKGKALESASRSAVRRLSLLSSVSLFALAARVVPIEIDPDTYLPTVSSALAKDGSDDDSSGSDDDSSGSGSGSDDDSSGSGSGSDDDDAADAERDAARDAADAERDAARAAADAARDAARDAADALADDAARDAARDAADATRDATRDAADAERDAARDAADAERDAARDAADAVRDAARDAADAEAEPNEVVAAGFDATSLAQAAALGFEIKERRRLPNLGIDVAVFQLPLGLDARTGRERLSALSPGAAVDLNHFYTPQATLRPPARKYAADMIGWGAAPKGCGQGLRIGIIDTPIDLNHRAFQGRRIEARSFLRRPGGISPSNHGTAVAALLVGNDRVDRHAGLLPGAQLFAANIFALRKGRMRANALSVASALDWLIGERVRVVNLSLSGPPNRLLAQAVAHAARNMILVAAAGNAGANGRARYPAAYPDVLAVTATDSQLRPYGRANRGAYIDVAAPGVGIWTAATNLRGRYESGTSFAVPFVTAAVAALMMDGESVTVPEIRKIFARTALDLGEPGKDEVFGWGLVQARPCKKKTARHQ